MRGGGYPFLGPAFSAATAKVAYEVSTSVDPTVESTHCQCVSEVGTTHLHPSCATSAASI